MKKELDELITDVIQLWQKEAGKLSEGDQLTQTELK